MNKITVVVTYFGEGTERLEFSTEEAFEAFEKGWELGSLFSDENAGYERLADVTKEMDKSQ